MKSSANARLVMLLAAALLPLSLRCNSAPDLPPSPFAPNFGSVKTQEVPPPPISGGTMLLSLDGKTAIVADADRDAVSFVDLAGQTVRAHVDLNLHDEPGRLVEDTHGLVYVALRGSGDLATFRLSTGTLIDRRSACPEPRGVAYDSARDQVLVACNTGELVTLPAVSGPIARSVKVARGLRDIVTYGDRIYVSDFRAAKILTLDSLGSIIATQPVLANGATSARDTGGLVEGSPTLAWRMRAQGQSFVVVFQTATTTFASTSPGGYAGGSGPVPSRGGIVHAAVAKIPSWGGPETSQVRGLEGAVLPVDFAVDSRGQGAVVAAGNWKNATTPAFIRFDLSTGRTTPAAGGSIDGQVVSIEIDARGNLLLQSREPAALYTVDANGTVVGSVRLSDVSREDTGHTIFHTNTGGSLACASCHGEGGDDAQTWNFDGTRARRTPSLRGTVKGTAPYHWDGEFSDMRALVDEVFRRRMAGPELGDDHVAALRGWIEKIPAPKTATLDPAADPSARARGEVLFRGDAKCASCHSGGSFTNNATVAVGADPTFRLQVPPLVGVGARSPFLHDGCAVTLTDRFTSACGGTNHGDTTNLSSAQIADLVAFLDSI